MNYYQYKINCTPEQAEWLVTIVGQQPFDSFEDTETGFNAYIPERLFTAETDADMENWKEQFAFAYEKVFIPYKNWNEVWESNFQAIEVEDFVRIRADFHPTAKGFEHEIVINPKMAFGTGHHETTYMMMLIMRDLDLKDKSVFDYGCGTGILAILAAMRGSVDLDAVDIELPSYENTIENCEINKIQGVKTYHGVLETVPARKYDVILANINRNVILPSLQELYTRLEAQGDLLISGFIQEDEELMADAVAKGGFKIIRTEKRGNWICQQLKKL